MLVSDKTRTTSTRPARHGRQLGSLQRNSIAATAYMYRSVDSMHCLLHASADLADGRCVAFVKTTPMCPQSESWPCFPSSVRTSVKSLVPHFSCLGSFSSWVYQMRRSLLETAPAFPFSRYSIISCFIFSTLQMCFSFF